jgi:hypothetical protein
VLACDWVIYTLGKSFIMYTSVAHCLVVDHGMNTMEQVGPKLGLPEGVGPKADVSDGMNSFAWSICKGLARLSLSWMKASRLMHRSMQAR